MLGMYEATTCEGKAREEVSRDVVDIGNMIYVA